MKVAHTLLVLAAMTSVSFGASIYVNFNGNQTGGGPATGSPFGIPAASWINTGNAANNAVGIALGTTSTLTWTSPNVWGDGSVPTIGDESVYGGYLDDQANLSPTFTVAGLTAEFGGGAYIITVYNFSDNPANPTGAFTLNGGAAVSSTSTAATGTLTGNYGITTFSGVTGDSITISGFVDGTNNTRSTISGFSITPVPEPSAVALLGLGGLGLMMRRRK